LHDRQVVIVEPADWAEWLTSDGDVGHLLHPSPSGHIKVEQVN
jgi:putative SOS response-associated peptidase YedK